MNDDLAAGAALTFEARLDRLAELVVRVGLNLAPGQELVMTASVEALDLSAPPGNRVFQEILEVIAGQRRR